MTPPLSVICWKWAPPAGYRSAFGPKTVNTLRRMVARHLHRPHRFICVTDDSRGLDQWVHVVPLGPELAQVANPVGPGHPSCYRRLRAFAPDAGQVFGDRFLSLDLDTVIVNDITPLVDRSEDFVIWGETKLGRRWYNGSMWLLTAGARAQVWEQFDPNRSPAAAHAAGQFGSDQGWIRHCLGPDEATWGREDGVYSFRSHIDPRRRTLPANVRIVMWHGQEDPWGLRARQLHWVREHYR